MRLAALARVSQQTSAVAWLNWEILGCKKENERGRACKRGIHTKLKCMHWSRIKCMIVLCWGGGGKSFS